MKNPPQPAAGLSQPPEFRFNGDFGRIIAQMVWKSKLFTLWQFQGE